MKITWITLFLATTAFLLTHLLGMYDYPWYPQDVLVTAPQTQNIDRVAHINHLVASIYFLESTSGKFDPCVRDNEGYNGYGFVPGFCWNSHQEVTALVTKWIETRYDTMTEGQMLCYYNKGLVLDTCDYYRNYKSI